MKKLGILIGTIFCAYSVNAHESFSYYIGASGGVNVNSAEIAQASTLDLLGVRVTPSADLDSNELNAIGQIQVGAGYTLDRFYLGAELAGQIFNGNFGTVSSGFEDTQPPIAITDESTLSLNDFELALDFKPGVYLFKQTLLYARIGVGVNELELTQNSYAENTMTGDYLQAYDHTSENVYPFRLGLGLERQFTENFTIVFDYVFSQYRDISATAFDTENFADGEERFDVDLESNGKADDIIRQTAMIGLNYYF